MLSERQRYFVGGVDVSLVRLESGPHWECALCTGDCGHILIAALRLTLESWEGSPEPAEEALFPEN